MQLLILAAGYGGRLSPATDKTPKALLELSQGVTILDRQIEAARQCGLKKIHIVTGFESKKIEDKIQEEKYKDLDITIHFNPFYKITNNMVSLWVAREIMHEDFIMLNSDSIFRPEILKQLKESPKQLTVMISKKISYDSDDTKLKLNCGKIVQISKNIPINEVDAEWIGMCCIKSEKRELFLQKLDVLMRKPHLLDGHPHYLSVFQGIADDGMSIDTIMVESDEWCEVDYQADLEFARSHMTRFL
jgi:choline kinase